MTDPQDRDCRAQKRRDRAEKNAQPPHTVRCAGVDVYASDRLWLSGGGAFKAVTIERRGALIITDAGGEKAKAVIALTVERKI